MLTVNKGLKSLVLNDNYIFTTCIIHLGLALIRNSTLCKLECYNKNMDIFDEIIFAWVLEKNRNLLAVTLSENSYLTKDKLLKSNNIEAYDLTKLIRENLPLSSDTTLKLFKPKSAVEHKVVETLKISWKKAIQIVEEALIPARTKYTLELLGVRKHCTSGISINHIDLTNKTCPFLEAMPNLVLEKIFSYNVFEDNVNKYVRNADIIKKQFNKGIETNDYDALERIVPKMKHKTFDSVLERKDVSNDHNIKQFIDKHKISTKDERKYQDFVNSKKRAWER